jgi:NAD(P)-dependent dehydrogenase (short-subunit alcohol dehydrogenase family)
VEVSQLDLADPKSIAAFVARWIESKRALHILIDNAAPTPSKTVVRDARGYEMQFAASHLGHFQLTVGWDDPNFNDGYDSRKAYARSKKADVLFAVEMDRRYANDGIRACCELGPSIRSIRALICSASCTLRALLSAVESEVRASSLRPSSSRRAPRTRCT